MGFRNQHDEDELKALTEQLLPLIGAATFEHVDLLQFLVATPWELGMRESARPFG